jgi:recombination protein RecT
MSIEQAVAQRQEAQPSLGTLVQRLRPELTRALPKHMDGDRMARLALTVLRQTPKLGQCSPQSFAGALLTAAALGLEPGVNGEAYLVPYEVRKGPRRGQVDCQLILGYQGLAKLFWQNPLARHLDAQAVYERDDFDYAYGLEPMLRHRPATGDRGKVVAYYAVAALASGGSAFVVLSPEDVKALRQGKVGPSGDIADPMRWMERKTALRQLLKILPRSATLAAALNADERTGTELHARKAHENLAELGTEPLAELPPAGVDLDTGEIHEGELLPEGADS